MRYNETEAYIPPLQTLTAWRRDLHRHPELALNLPWTSAYIKEILKQTGAEILEPMDSTVAAWFDFGAPDTLMFRADMDALPVQEQTGVPWCSQTPGCMHACGHDVHMTVLLGFAMVLSRMKESPFNILLVFQPGEENPGGARLICESGLLERFGVRAAFGLHVWPALPAGTIATRPGPMMAASSEVDITIRGQSAPMQPNTDREKMPWKRLCSLLPISTARKPHCRRKSSACCGSDGWNPAPSGMWWQIRRWCREQCGPSNLTGSRD